MPFNSSGEWQPRLVLLEQAEIRLKGAIINTSEFEHFLWALTPGKEAIVEGGSTEPQQKLLGNNWKNLDASGSQRNM